MFVYVFSLKFFSPSSIYTFKNIKYMWFDEINSPSWENKTHHKETQI